MRGTGTGTGTGTSTVKTHPVIKVVKNRPRTFFGLWMEHKPIYTVFFEFKRAGVATVVAI
jgi:hypothetical protein